LQYLWQILSDSYGPPYNTYLTIEFQDVDDKVKGPGLWKSNCSLLNDKQYVNEINCLFPSWLQEGKQDLSDPCSVWD